MLLQDQMPRKLRFWRMCDRQQRHPCSQSPIDSKSDPGDLSGSLAAERAWLVTERPRPAATGFETHGHTRSCSPENSIRHGMLSLVCFKLASSSYKYLGVISKERNVSVEARRLGCAMKINFLWRWGLESRMQVCFWTPAGPIEWWITGLICSEDVSVPSEIQMPARGLQ